MRVIRMVEINSAATLGQVRLKTFWISARICRERTVSAVMVAVRLNFAIRDRPLKVIGKTLVSTDHGVPIAAGVFRRADSPPKRCFAPDSELPDQAESSQESSQCTARGEIPVEITVLTK